MPGLLRTAETTSGNRAKNPNRLVWHLKERRFARVTRVTIRARDRLKWCYTAFIWCVSRVGTKTPQSRTILECLLVLAFPCPWWFFSSHLRLPGHSFRPALRTADIA